jgi:membrane protease YdiL (CAAX protease family)
MSSSSGKLLPRRDLPRHPLVRIVAAGVPLFAIYIGAQLGKGVLGRQIPASVRIDFQVVMNLTAAVLMLAGYRIAVRLLEHRCAHEAARRHLLGLPVGLAIGSALFCVVELVSLLAGISHSLGYQGLAHVMPELSGSMLAAVGEEIIFRGVLFRLLEEAFGTVVGLVVSAIVFGLIHALNSAATITGVVAVALEAGVLLVLAYAVARSLWLPIGIHLGWNFTEGGVFGSAVSGGGASAGVFPMALHGPTLLTGGTFGLEASVISVAVCLTASTVLGGFAYKHGRFKHSPKAVAAQ